MVRVVRVVGRVAAADLAASAVVIILLAPVGGLSAPAADRSLLLVRRCCSAMLVSDRARLSAWRGEGVGEVVEWVRVWWWV